MTSQPPGSEGYEPYGLGVLEVRREDQRLVVTRADSRIGMYISLWEDIRNGKQEQLEGSPVIDELGIAITFGSPGHGLGRLTYDVKDMGYGWVTLERAK